MDRRFFKRKQNYKKEPNDDSELARIKRENKELRKEIDKLRSDLRTANKAFIKTTKELQTVLGDTSLEEILATINRRSETSD